MNWYKKLKTTISDLRGLEKYVFDKIDFFIAMKKDQINDKNKSIKLGEIDVSHILQDIFNEYGQPANTHFSNIIDVFLLKRNDKNRTIGAVLDSSVRRNTGNNKMYIFVDNLIDPMDKRILMDKIQHEMRHFVDDIYFFDPKQKTYSTDINYVPRDMKEYFGDENEIMAFSYNIARFFIDNMEVFNKIKTEETPEKAIERLIRSKKAKIENTSKYLLGFFIKRNEEYYNIVFPPNLYKKYLLCVQYYMGYLYDGLIKDFQRKLLI